MTVPAFTNAIGEFHKSDYFQDEERGVVDWTGDGPVEYYRQENNVVATGYSYKPEPIHGDHDGPQPYVRRIHSVIKNEPESVRVVSHRPDGSLQWDYISKKHLSNYFPLGNMAEPDRYVGLRGNAASKAVTNARERLRTGRASYGSAIGEARQTADMLSGTASNVLKAYEACRHGNFALAAKLLGLNSRSIFTGKGPSNAWLAYQFGWLPMIGDIQDGVKRLVGGYRDKGFIHYCSATGRAQFTEQPNISNGVSSYWECSGGTRVAYEYRITVPYLDSLDGSGVINPLSVAWELEPFSFIVDWFVPVGNVLESLTATAGLELAAGYQTDWDDNIFYARSVGTENLVIPGELIFHRYTHHRYKLPDFLPPQLYAKDNPFTTTHVLDFLALLRQHL